MIKPFKKLCGLVLSLSVLAGCASVKPKGSILLSYLPKDIEYGKRTEDVIKTGIEAGLETKIKEVAVYLYGDFETWSTKDKNSIYFNPFLQKYGIGLITKYDNLSFYVRHECTHAVGSNREIHFNKDREIYFVNFGGFNELGVKYEW